MNVRNVLTTIIPVGLLLTGSCAENSDPAFTIGGKCTGEGELLGLDGTCKCQEGFLDADESDEAMCIPIDESDCGCRNPDNDDPDLPECERSCSENLILWYDHCDLLNYATECGEGKECKYLFETGEAYCASS